MNDIVAKLLAKKKDLEIRIDNLDSKFVFIWLFLFGNIALGFISRSVLDLPNLFNNVDSAYAVASAIKRTLFFVRIFYTVFSIALMYQRFGSLNKIMKHCINFYVFMSVFSLLAVGFYSPLVCIGYILYILLRGESFYFRFLF